MTSEFAVAVHALVFLNHKGDTQSSEAVAENVCTNPARVRKVMARLKRAGLVQTKEGLDGGYHFIKDPARVDLWLRPLTRVWCPLRGGRAAERWIASLPPAWRIFWIAYIKGWISFASKSWPLLR